MKMKKKTFSEICFQIETMKKAKKPIKQIYKMLENNNFGKIYSKYRLIFVFPVVPKMV